LLKSQQICKLAFIAYILRLETATGISDALVRYGKVNQEKPGYWMPRHVRDLSGVIDDLGGEALSDAWIAN